MPSPFSTAPRVSDVRVYFPHPDDDEKLAQRADVLAAKGDEGVGDMREMLMKVISLFLLGQFIAASALCAWDSMPSMNAMSKA